MLSCSACHAEARDDVRFCEACGASLARTCGGCGARLGEGARFCGACGRPAESEEVATPEGDRRQLTVLFCDLAGSTRLSAQLDPEDWSEVVRSYQQASAAVVERMGGHVAQYLGDGILVYFGYPLAHEDSAERAVRAGLGIVEAVGRDNPAREARYGISLQLRVGIHTGPVVMGEMGSGARRETLALGETTNLAARLQGEAEPDTVVISAATLRLVQGLFQTEDRGERELAGIRQPVPAYRVVRSSGVRSGLDGQEPSRLTPLVGREAQLAQLLEAWEAVCEGHGRVVTIGGEAGIGKSRLMRALRDTLSDTPHTWLECGASPYYQDSPLHPVLELQQQGLRFAAGDSPEQRLRKLEAGIAAAGFDVEETLPVLARFHSLPLPADRPTPNLSPEGWRNRTLEALAEWLLRMGHQQPVVMLVEDLHWIDPSTLELLQRVVKGIAGERVLLLMTHRPELEPAWVGSPPLVTIVLSRLEPSSAGEMARAVARETRVPDSVIREIVRRTDGVPLFVEELTKTLLASPELSRLGDSDPLAEFTIPETLQDLLMARLDRLGPVKQVVQLGSCLGREFSHEILAAIAPVDEEELESLLARAVGAELLYQRGAPPDTTYQFKHALTREAAYQSLLRSSRERHHRLIAETLEKDFGDLVESQPELVAHHLTLGQQTGRAIDYWQRAGARAVERSAVVEAGRHLGRALDALGKEPEDPSRDLRELAIRTLQGVALMASEGYGSEEVRRTFSRAHDLCRGLGYTPQLLPTLFGLWVFHLVRADREETLGFAQRLLDVAEQTGETTHRIQAHMARALTSYYRASHDDAIQSAETVLELYDPEQHAGLAFLFGQDPGVYAHAAAASSHWFLGRPDRALALARDGIALGERVGHPFSLAAMLAFAAFVHVLRGEVDACEELAERDLQLSIEQNFPLWQAWSRAFAGWVRAKRGDSGDTVSELEQVIALHLQTGALLTIPQLQAILTEASAGTGDIERRLQRIEAADAMLRTNLDAYFVPEIRRLRGDLLLERDGPCEAVEGAYRAALEIARGQKAHSLELRAATSLARLWQSEGRKDEARALLAPVYETFTEGLGTHDLAEADALLRALG